MPTNNQVLLSEIVKRDFADNPQFKSEDTFFEFFAAQQVLKKYDLSDEEVEENLTGNGNDGGCDAIFLFADGELLHEDDAVEEICKHDVRLTLYIFQAKNTTSFGEQAFDKWKTVSSNLLELGKSCDDFKGRYDDKVLRAFTFFKDTYIKLIRKRAKLNIEFQYVTKGTEKHPNVLSR